MQAVSDIVHGGDLVTTVCHSTPFAVDTTPPVFRTVDGFLFDETFRYLAIYYNASDAISGIRKVEFGLGKTKYDVRTRRYVPLEIRGRAWNRYVVSSDFETAAGVPAWIRLKVVDNGMLICVAGSMSDTRSLSW